MAASSNRQPKLSELAATIAAKAKQLEDYIEKNNLPYPSFNVDGPSEFPIPETPETEELTEARKALISASKQLHDLTVGPDDHIRWLVWNYADVAALHFISAFDIANIVPLNGDMSYADLGKAISVDESKTRTMMRVAMTNHIFTENRHGYVAHTASSKVLREPLMANWIAYNTEDLAPVAQKGVEACQKWPDSGEHEETAFALANGENESLFQFLGKRPAKAKRFGTAMASFASGPEHAVSHLVKGDVWKRLPEDATIVDVGAATGYVSVELAKEYPKFNFVIEDKVPAQLELGKAQLPEELKPRFQYVVQDFLADQTVKGADAYLIRWCLHNWSDKYALRIIKSLIPGLRNGSKVILNEIALPSKNDEWDPFDERKIRLLDSVMLLCLNGLEREDADWRKLFAAADSRFIYDGYTRPHGSLIAIVEATFIDT